MRIIDISKMKFGDNLSFKTFDKSFLLQDKDFKVLTKKILNL